MSTPKNELVAHWVDLLQPLGPVMARAMFGGHGIYLEGTMFALVADDELYLKVDDQTEARFEAEGLPRFVYEKKGGGSMSMSYRKAPVAALDDGELLVAWARLGVDAAHRAAKAKVAPRARKVATKAKAAPRAQKAPSRGEAAPRAQKAPAKRRATKR